MTSAVYTDLFQVFVVENIASLINSRKHFMNIQS